MFIFIISFQHDVRYKCNLIRMLYIKMRFILLDLPILTLMWIMRLNILQF